MKWRFQITCRHGGAAAELHQCLFYTLCIFLLNKGLEAAELLQDRFGLASTLYAGQEVIHCSRQVRGLSCTPRGCRSTQEMRRAVN